MSRGYVINCQLPAFWTIQIVPLVLRVCSLDSQLHDPFDSGYLQSICDSIQVIINNKIMQIGSLVTLNECTRAGSSLWIFSQVSIVIVSLTL